MVLVRRRADGLYYDGARSNAGYGRGEWVEDIQQCLPYKNRRGAMAAFRSRCYLLKEEGERYPRWEYHPERFDAEYEIVEVKLVFA